MRLRDLLSSEEAQEPADPCLLRLLRLPGGEQDLDRPVLGTVTIDLPDPGRFVSPGDLVLSGLAWHRQDAGAGADAGSGQDAGTGQGAGAGRSDAFVRVLVEAGAVALGAGEAQFGHVPDDLVEACARYGLPLLAVGVEVPFTSVTEYVARGRTEERIGGLAALVDRHRRFSTQRQAGAGAEALLELLLAELDLHAHILSPTGRQIAGAQPPLPEKTASALAGRFLAAERAGERAPHRTVARGTAFSLFPVRSGTGDGDSAPGAALTDWLIAVEADSADWNDERLDLLDRLARLVSVERGGRDTDRTMRRRAAERLLALVGSAAAVGEGGQALFEEEEAAARLTAGDAGAAGAEGRLCWQAVSARLDSKGAHGFPVAASVRDLLEEVLLHPRCLGPDAGPRMAVTAAGDGAEAVAFMLVGADARLTPEAVVRVAGGSLPRGLRGGERLAFGVSDPVGGVAELRHALAQARNARQVAAPSEQVAARGPDDLAAHVMALLPLIPAEVRREFSRRLLAPLTDYDRRYRSDLVPTLRSFLEHDGSWARCGEALHLHVNSLRYRISRIEALTGRNLSRLEDKMDFAAALQMG
ncbi:helix-turn-helix domain-containing protein [Streptomyces sp. ZAF1911]|uniref:PucR family transcriptional regulator n=1 Tax=Streptomyces sp. ZAF1911 TaxID=2944129 RepID=UPI00237A4A37|nr:PucR family transcriptional regulator [Streptomyces sp. ZAF1911]MDD9376867.1 helix-turn-helix domain-containing protein [Streptomyces sp. ZAF1911]